MLLFSKNIVRQVIVTGDDFGLSAENNAGILGAYRSGVLTCTSLMVGGDAAQAAVALAQQNPGLAVGLHLSFGDTRPDRTACCGQYAPSKWSIPSWR